MARMSPLSSMLHANFHSGAQDVRAIAWSDIIPLPETWRQSITDLSYSVTGLWDSVIRAIQIFF